MWDTIGTIALILLAVVGMVEVVRGILFVFLDGKGESGVMMIVPICGHNEEAEYLLRSAAAKTRWFSGPNNRRVICLDCGMDEETRAVCELISADYPFMEICPLGEFEAVFGQRWKEPLAADTLNKKQHAGGERKNLE